MGPAGAGSKDSPKSLVQKLKGRMQEENLKIVSSKQNKIQEVRHLPSCQTDRWTEGQQTLPAPTTDTSVCLHRS